MLKNKPCVLIVDDDSQIRSLVKNILEAEKYQVATADSGQAAMDEFKQQQPDLVLLDIMLPDIDGYTVCRRIREDSTVPIIMLTGMGSDKEKVKGLDAGADDYLVKPFSIEELSARIRAVLRRSRGNLSSSTPANEVFTSGNFEINYVKRQITLAGVEIKLTPTEFYLLQELTFNAGKVLTYSYILNKVWGPEYGEERQYLHVFIGNLRAKLNRQPNDHVEIETIAGVGYRFKECPGT